MTRTKYIWVCCAFCLCVACSAPAPKTVSAKTDAMDDAPRELVFEPVRIDGPVHNPAKHTFWFGPFAECSSVLDINGDGKIDIAAGRNFYIAPDWKKYADYRDGAETNGPDVDDNYEGTLDVNGDGRPDVISSGWMRRQGIWWYENPGKLGPKWESHSIVPADGLEGMVIGNLAGHGENDLLVNYFAKKPGRSLIWMEHLNQAPWFKEHKLGPEGLGISHGNGIGDLNGDGRNDVVTATGWFEAPAHPADEPWVWHADYEFAGGGAGLPILIADVNGDGLNDIIMGSAHRYGLVWFEQKMSEGKRTFTEHWIERDYPTIHTMMLADLDGDGKPELITGKQLFAHNGGDVGALDPVFIFYYRFSHGHFERHVLTYSYLTPYFGSKSENAPPPSYVVGTGMRLNAADIDGNGKQDVIVACKTGLYIFYNKGYPSMQPKPSVLPERTSYPSHVEWEKPHTANK